MRWSTRSTSSPRCRSGWPRAASVVVYEVTAELGPPHERTFEVRAAVQGEELGSGSGRSKKAAEQEAARRALERLENADG